MVHMVHQCSVNQHQTRIQGEGVDLYGFGGLNTKTYKYIHALIIIHLVCYSALVCPRLVIQW